MFGTSKIASLLCRSENKKIERTRVNWSVHFSPVFAGEAPHVLVCDLRIIVGRHIVCYVLKLRGAHGTRCPEMHPSTVPCRRNLSRANQELHRKFALEQSEKLQLGRCPITTGALWAHTGAHRPIESEKRSCETLRTSVPCSEEKLEPCSSPMTRTPTKS